MKDCIHFVCPVVYRFFIIDFFAQPMNERARRPHLPARLLLRKHRVENRHEPVLELAVVVVRYNEVTDAVHTPFTEGSTIESKVGEVCLSKALDKVLLDTAGGGHECFNVLVLDKI